jgi:uncharacterized protein (TIGR03000 family)
MCRTVLSILVGLIVAGAAVAAAERDKPSRQADRATISISLPANATLWAEGVKLRSNGPAREFTTPPLAAGRRYSYEFRASWNEGGRTITQTQKVEVKAGTKVRVRFPVQAEDQRPAAFEGRIKDVRFVWGILVLSVGEGKKARDIRFDISDARIVGPSGAEWKGQDLRRGYRVRVEMAASGRLVQQVSVLPDQTSAQAR